MEVSQEIYHTAQLHSCPKGWENEPKGLENASISALRYREGGIKCLQVSCHTDIDE